MSYTHVYIYIHIHTYILRLSKNFLTVYAIYLMTSGRNIFVLTPSHFVEKNTYCCVSIATMVRQIYHSVTLGLHVAASVV
jgi:hypothetical protein